LRAFLALCTHQLYDVLRLPPLMAATVALVFIATGMAGPALARSIGLARALVATAIGLAVFRVAEQLVTRPRVDVWLAALGVACFALYLALHMMVAKREGAVAGFHLGLVVVVGMTADLALHAVLRTLDLSWQTGFWPLLIVIPLALLLAASAIGWWPRGQETDDPLDPPRLPLSFALVGCWLFVELLVFQNVATLAARSGQPLPVATLTVALADALGLVTAVWLAGWKSRPWLAGWKSRPRWLPALMALGIAIALPFDHQANSWSLLGVLVGGALAVPLVTLLYEHVAVTRVVRRSAVRSAVAAGSPLILFFVLLFLYYGTFELELGFSAPRVMVWAALLILAAGLVEARDEILTHPLPVRAGVPLATALLLPAVAVVLWATWRAPQPLTAASPVNQVRVMTYNLHQGFDPYGRHDPEALARVIEASGADVVALQEVSRGWVINSSLDLLGWLSVRLQMPMVFGPTADPHWGNALLTRLPVTRSESFSLPDGPLPLRRGYLDVDLDLGGQTLRVLVTHLIHTRRAGPVRERQARALLDGWDGSSRTLIMGDLNDPPDAPSIGHIRDAGFHKATALLPPGERATHHRKGPRELDYIWGTPDLIFSDTEIPNSEASDHRPIVVTVHPR
jgi:endonuclease/exonuclease/phosphatase family metal-dependent hydrolase